MPHHSNNMTLSELIVGSTQWTIDLSGITNKVDLVKMGASDWSLKYGYLDEKPVISGNNTQGRVTLPLIFEYFMFIIYAKIVFLSDMQS